MTENASAAAANDMSERISAATNMVKAGVDIQTVANILGHNSISTTQRYAAVLEENKQQAVEALDNLF